MTDQEMLNQTSNRHSRAGYAMTHDPLCQIKNPHPDWTRCASCYFIAKVREDMLAKCIDRMTDSDLDDLVCDDHKDIIFKALLALRDKI